MEAQRGNISDESARQVIGYLKHQASKKAADLLPLVDRAQGVIERSLAGVSEAQARFCPEPGEWCIAEVLQHIERSTRGTARAIAALAAGERATPSGIEPEVTEASETLAELRRRVGASFDELRAAMAAMPDGESGATAQHPFFGELTCKEWAAFGYVHARDHAAQIEKNKQAPAYPR